MGVKAPIFLPMFPVDQIVKNVLIDHSVSKLIVDEPEVPESVYERIKPVAESVDDLAREFNGFSFEDPYSWYSTGKSLTKKFLNLPEYEEVSDVLGEEISEVVWGRVLLGDLFREVESSKYMEVKNDDIHKTIYQVGDLELYYSRSDGIDAYYCNYADIHQKLSKASPLFWRDKDYPVRVVKSEESGLNYLKLENDRGEFVGEERKYIDEIQRFYDKGINRTILLQGPPGTGKTTFAYNILEQLGSRVIFVDHPVINQYDPSNLSLVISFLSPDVVVMDDIDRCDHQLELLEIMRGVPITIMTSNYAHKLPKAFLRPGRIDQIIEMTGPGDAAKKNMVDYFAKKLDMEVENYEQYFDIIDEHTPVFLEEYMRRKSVLGDDYEIPPEDMTFEDIGREKKFNSTVGGPGLLEKLENSNNSDNQYPSPPENDEKAPY